MTYSTIEYPAIVYRTRKGNSFAANCIIKKVVGFGKTETEALNNLQTMLNTASDEYFVKVRPFYG